MADKPTTIDEYLAHVSEDKRAALESLRHTIRSIVPEAEECISYAMPAFRLGKVIGGFAAGKSFCSYYPFSGRVIDTLKEDLAGYETTIGAIHFTVEKPLPESLVRKLLMTRIAEERG